MGLFDRLRKKKEISVTNETHENENILNMPKLTITQDGRLNAEFNHNETREFYDTTKLTIDYNHPFMIAGQNLYNCVVAWDGRNDCRLLDSIDNSQIAGNRNDYKGVWLDIDLGKLQTDPNYCNVLMNELLLRSRVYQYIENGLKENPERPCGKYIGGVREQNGIYNKYFSATVGRAAHNDPFMVDRRAKLREKAEADKAARIEAKKQQMAKLQDEINELNGR